MGIFEEIAGFVLAIVVLMDIFLLILYARANKSIISKEISHVAWSVFVALSRPLGRRRGQFLTFGGPVILVMVLGSYALLLSVAMALIIHPNLGTGIVKSQGETPTDFLTALYVGGSSLSFIGASDFSPQNGFFRIFYLITSLIGVSLASLIVTYLMELYTNLKERNTLGLKTQLLSSETGDAAEVIAHLGPQGMFDAGYNVIVDWAAETAQVKESHHFYPMLFFFRFADTYYSVSRTTLTSLDTVSLIKSALDDKEFGWLKESSAVNDLWSGALMEVRILAEDFLPKETEFDTPPNKQTRVRWQKRYAEAVKRIKAAGIKTKDDGEEDYISLRKQWDGYIMKLAPKFAFFMDEVDPALAKVK